MKVKLLALMMSFASFALMSAAVPLTVRSDSDTIKTVSLDEVEVKASNVIQKGDKTKILITREMRRGTRSVGEMLGNEPNFFFDRGYNTLTYNNSSNIILLVDSIEKDLSTLNKQHIRYDYVEIVNHPTGKYDGYDVLINLHTKQNYEGYDGYVYHNTGLFLNKYSDDAFFNNEGSITYTRNKLTFSAYGHFYSGRGEYDKWFDQYYKLNGLRNTVVPTPDGNHTSKFNEPRVQTVISGDYKFNKYRSLSFSYRYNGKWDEASDSMTILRSYDDERADVTLGINSDSYTQRNEHAIGVFYKDNSGKVKYSANVNYRFMPTKNYGSMTETTGFSMDNYFHDRMHFLTYGIDGWTYPNNNNKLYLGAGYVGTWKSYLRRDRNTDTELNSNSYLRNRLWATCSYMINPKVTLSATAWAEHIHSKSGSLSANSLPFGGNMMLFLRMTKTNWMRFNYDCNVAHPDQDMSSEYAYFTDSLTMNSGNPLLKSNISHNFRYWFDAWNCFNVQTGFSISPNTFSYVAGTAEGTLPSGQHGMYVMNVWQNTDFKNWWASASFTKRFLKNFVYKADVKYSTIKASWQNYSNSGRGVTISTSLNYYWPRQKMNFFVAYSYQRLLSISPQTHAKGNFEYPQIYITRTFFKDKLDVTLNYRTMFHFTNCTMHTYTDSPALYSHYYDNNYKRQTHNLMIQLRYRFSGGKSVRQFKHEISNEE